ncbi:cytochrome P450 [Colletotrichum camelliae]|nr:cytochrome P450 [Colletotrichum camelliae]
MISTTDELRVDSHVEMEKDTERISTRPQNLVYFLLAAVITHRIGLIVYRLYLSPLAKFPGPKIAAATSWYEGFWDLWNAQFPEVVKDMHEKYGPIVRVNPRELVIQDADFYSQLYVPAGKRSTHTIMGLRAGLGMSDAIVTTSQHELHHMRRKAVEGFFSKQSVTRMETRIHHEARRLDEKLRQLSGTGQVIQLDHAFSAVAGDLAAQFACGESPELIEDPAFNPDWHTTLTGILTMVPYVRNFPWINDIMRLVPVWILKALNPQLAGIRIFHLFSEGRIETIKREMNGHGKDDEDTKSSIFHHILRSDLPETEKATDRLNREAFALLAAGTITTSSTMTLITYFVLENPNIEKRLRQDLQQVTACYPETVPRWADLEKVPFLTACIKEGLRLAHFMRRNIRIAPDVDLKYGQWTIPKNTPVGMHVCHLHMDPEVYPEPTKFMPERWLGDYDPRMNRNLVPFVRGSRNCLGLNLAWAEMYIFLGVIFGSGAHRMSLECEASDIVPIRDSDVGFQARGAQGLRVRIH